MVQCVKHPLRRTAQLVAHELDAIGRGRCEPLLVAARQLDVGLGVVLADSLWVHAGYRQHDRGDDTGAVFSGEAVEQHRAFRRSDRLEDRANGGLPPIDHEEVTVLHGRRCVEHRRGGVRALFRPYFLRSFILASRVRRPAFFNAGRKSGSYLTSARAMPCAMAPAWPLLPPPITFTLMSNLRWVLVTRSGASAAISRTRRPRD